MQVVNNYIDKCLIQEYATKNELDVDDLPAHEISNFLNVLMQEDTAVRDFVRYQMQKLIEQRLSY